MKYKALAFLAFTHAIMLFLIAAAFGHKAEGIHDYKPTTEQIRHIIP